MIAGRYSLDREIGRGGMGAVWLGRDEVLGRAVALKRIGALAGAGSPDFDRAEREARLAARLNHPHVVAVFDLVREGGEQWLVMEYVEGTTLAELVRSDGALSPDQASPIIAQAADALAAAHRAGIVHRDVKPSNMLVSPDGGVKLSDFGIARAQADASLTQTGLVTGSPAYLAPEVAQGRVATSASDSWSLGASLFHALSGQPPYDVGDNLLGALYRIVHEEPPRLADAGWLSSLLTHTMTHDPDQRWDMAEIKAFLDAGPTAAVVRPLPGRRSRRPAPAAAAEGTQLLAPVGVLADRTATPADPGRPPVVPLEAPAAGRRRRPGAWAAVLAALVAVLLVTVIAFAVGLGNGDDSSPQAGASPTADPSSSATQSPQGPTAAGMTAFIEDYVATAASSPRAGFALLTADYQNASDGFTGYSDFWGNVETASLDPANIDADPDTMQVRYTYTYTLANGTTRTEPVALRLSYDAGTGRYLIAGDA